MPCKAKKSIIPFSEAEETATFLAVRSGDEAARNKVAVNFLPLVRKLAGAAARRYSLDRSEAESAACYALTGAINNFIPGGRARFSSYLRRYVIGKLMALVSRTIRIRYFETPGFAGIPEFPAPDAEDEDYKRFANNILYRVIRDLSPNDRIIVLGLFFEGRSLAETGALCNPPVTFQTVRRRREQILKRMKKAGLQISSEFTSAT